MCMCFLPEAANFYDTLLPDMFCMSRSRRAEVKFYLQDADVIVQCTRTHTHTQQARQTHTDWGLRSDSLTSFRHLPGMPARALPTDGQQAVYYRGNYLWGTDASSRHVQHAAALCPLASTGPSRQVAIRNLIKTQTMGRFPR